MNAEGVGIFFETNKRGALIRDLRICCKDLVT